MEDNRRPNTPRRLARESERGGKPSRGTNTRPDWGQGRDVPVESAKEAWEHDPAPGFTPRRRLRQHVTDETTSTQTGALPIHNEETPKSYATSSVRETTKPAAAMQRTQVAAPTSRRSQTRQSASDTKANRVGPTARTAFPHQNSTRTPKTKGRSLRRFLVISVVVALVAGGFYLAFNALGGTALFSGNEDYPGPGSGEVSITVPEGASGTSIGKILYENGVVASTGAFNAAFKDNPLAKSIQPGQYSLKKEMSAKEAVAALLNLANRVENKVTYVEGRMYRSFVDALVKQGVYTQEEVDKALADPAALGLPAQANGQFEGWLAPATYEIKPSTTAKDLFTQMIALTVERLESLKIPRDRWQNVLIKASIVEREVHTPEYYGKVARVIDNRLDLPNETAGFLGMDSTVLYGLGRDSGSLTQADLDKDTPYNTRTRKGLPPTPICSVGEAAIAAAANPTPGPWLYFVTTNLTTGETKFSTTNEEFQKDVAEYKEYCAANPGKC